MLQNQRNHGERGGGQHGGIGGLVGGEIFSFEGKTKLQLVLVISDAMRKREIFLFHFLRLITLFSLKFYSKTIPSHVSLLYKFQCPIDLFLPHKY